MPPPRLLLYLVAAAIPLVQSCGVLVHNEVVHRASHLFSHPNSLPAFARLQEQYSPLLLDKENAPLVQAGAFFPDWGYQCLATDDDAEAAHWPPFLIASVEHITSTYGLLNATASRSPAEQAHLENLIAFIFAIASHQTADTTWHAIRLPTGLLAALTGVDFDGDTDTAHRTLDFGTDFLMSARLARMDEASKDWISNEWKVPIDDLAAIYERIGRPVTKWVLRSCVMRGLAALRSELVIGERLLDTYAQRSPMLLDSIDSYYLGGLDEMSARTVNCWSNLTRWFSEGISREEKLRGGWGICDIFQAVKARGGAGVQAQRLERHSIWEEENILAHGLLEMTRITVAEEEFGVETYSLPPLETSAVAENRDELRKREDPKQPKFDDPSSIATFIGYGHLGTSVSVGSFAVDGEISLAIGAPWVTDDSSKPGAGEVYVVPSSYITSTSDFQTTSFNMTRAAGVTQTDQRFGTASTELKLFNTSFLAVSAPGPHTYDSGSPPALPWTPTAHAGRIQLFKPGEADPWLSFSLKGAELGSIGRRWWGENVISADFLGDGEEWLVVGGSRTDAMRECEGRQKVQFGEGEVVIIKVRASSVSPTSEDDLEDELQLPKGPGIRRVVTRSGQAVEVDTWTLTLPPQEKWGTPCEKTATYEYFGASTAFSKGTNTLFVGAPGREKVFAYQLQGDQFELVYEISADRKMDGNELRTGFGGGGIVAGKGWLAIAAPNENVDGRVQVGVVRVFKLPATAGRYPEEVAMLVPAEDEDAGGPYAKFGGTLAADGSELFIGSRFAKGEAGVVWWVDVSDFLSPGSRESVHTQQRPLRGPRKPQNEVVPVRSLLAGSEANAHFAHSLGTADLNADGKTDLIVGAPYRGVAKAAQDERFYGTVEVYYRL